MATKPFSPDVANATSGWPSPTTNPSVAFVISNNSLANYSKDISSNIVDFNNDKNNDPSTWQAAGAAASKNRADSYVLPGASSDEVDPPVMKSSNSLVNSDTTLASIGCVVRASQSDAEYEEFIEKKARSQRVVLYLSIAFTLLTVFSAEFFWFFPVLDEATNKTTSYWIPYRARWTEWKVFICLETVILIVSVAALVATRNIRLLETHVVVVLMGALAFCFLLSTTNAAVFVFVWTNHDRNDQALPKKGLSLADICATVGGIRAGGSWWMEYYGGSLPPTEIGAAEYEMMREMNGALPIGGVMAWATIVFNSIAAFFYLCSCQLGFFAMP